LQKKEIQGRRYLMLRANSVRHFYWKDRMAVMRRARLQQAAVRPLVMQIAAMEMYRAIVLHRLEGTLNRSGMLRKTEQREPLSASPGVVSVFIQRSFIE